MFSNCRDQLGDFWQCCGVPLPAGCFYTLGYRKLQVPFLSILWYLLTLYQTFQILLIFPTDLIFFRYSVFDWCQCVSLWMEPCRCFLRMPHHELPHITLITIRLMLPYFYRNFVLLPTCSHFLLITRCVIMHYLVCYHTFSVK